MVMILIVFLVSMMQQVVKENVRKFLTVNSGPIHQNPGEEIKDVGARQQMLMKL